MRQMRSDLRRYRAAFLLILAFFLGWGAQLLEAQVTLLPRSATFGIVRILSGGVINWNAGDVTLTHAANALTLAGGQWIIPAGTAALPGLVVGAAADEIGLYADNTNKRLYVAIQETSYFQFGTDNFSLFVNSLIFGLSSDARLTREGAAILEMGYDEAAPVAQTFKGPDGSGTDKAGASLTVAGGRGTGTGGGGSLILQTASASTTGSTQNSLETRATIASTGHLVLTELAADPGLAILTADAAVTVYTKADKLIFAYNNGGTLTFLSLVLDGSATTWVHSTVVP